MLINRSKLTKCWEIIGTVTMILPLVLVFSQATASGQTTYPDKPNPHDGSSAQNTNCDECHSKEAINALIHPMFNLDPGSEKMQIPETFPLEPNGDMNCMTCHLEVTKVDRSNRNFLRGGPYRRELDFCYNCHQDQNYQRINPHQQLLADGSTDESVCLHCHAKQPSPEDHPTIAQEMHMEMSATCNKCHALHTHQSNHSGRSLVGSKRATHDQYLATEKQFGIRLPLSVNDEIQGNTCHYTHGSLGIDAAIFEGSGDNLDYLRLPKEQLCYACHNL